MRKRGWRASGKPSPRSRRIGIGGYSKQAEKILRGRCAHSLGGNPAQPSDLFSNEAHKSRFVALAPVRDRCEVGSIGLDQHAFQRDATRHVLGLRCVLERHDAREGNVETKLERLLGDLPAFREAMHHATDVSGAFIMHDRQRVGSRSACVTPFAAILSSTAGMSPTSSGKLMWQCESTNIRWIRSQRSEELPRGSAARVTALIPDRWSLPTTSYGWGDSRRRLRQAPF